ncbi:hypothetical protein QEP73_11890 [Pseudomonas defluvii]|nr:hypothetical protein QEP73_11890 [Pseudomonas defluvii]
MNRALVECEAKLMMDAGLFTSVIADLIMDNILASHTKEREFLSEYRLDGLMRGLKLVAEELLDRGECLTELVEKDKSEQKKALTARQRRQGQDKSRESTVEGKCVTQRAA